MTTALPLCETTVAACPTFKSSSLSDQQPGSIFLLVTFEG
jgi:hypothetical protein